MLWSAITLLRISVIVFHHAACGVILWCKCYLTIAKIKLKKVSKGAKIRNRYNQVPYLTQDTNRKVINSQLDTTNESQEVSPFPVGDHKAHTSGRTQA